MLSPLIKNTQPKLYLPKYHSASAGSFTKILITLLRMRKQSFHQILHSTLSLETFFSLVKRTLASASRWFSGQESMNTLK